MVMWMTVADLLLFGTALRQRNRPRRDTDLVMGRPRQDRVGIAGREALQRMADPPRSRLARQQEGRLCLREAGVAEDLADAELLVLPKVDLHLHLVGSAAPHVVAELAARHPEVGVPADLERLQEFTPSGTSRIS